MTNTVFKFDNSYADELSGFYESFSGENFPSSKLLKINRELAAEIGLNITQLNDDEIAQIFSGSLTPEGAKPLAQVYAGHQFGGFSPRLGDGRALLLGEVIDIYGARRDIHLKGSGRTSYSRGGDGKAALAPVLREYILGEAMFALNVPTTRALAAVTTGENVMRESGMLPGAVLARVASSHIRVGTFQYFAARHEMDKVKQLADYTIKRHFPELSESKNPYLGLLCEVRDLQATLIAQWMNLGFIHGVMNTDNMTICGETIDYGPCAFMDEYDPSTVFSSIDAQGRYAYGNQPPIAQWNLARFAETLLPLIHDNNDESVRLATEEINAFSKIYQQHWLDGMCKKLGLSSKEDNDLALVNEILQAMEGQDVDFTQFFRELSNVFNNNADNIRDMFDDLEKIDPWLTHWYARLSRDPMSVEERMLSMNRVNPIYIPRNHKVEEALQAAETKNDYTLFEKLMVVLANPFEEREGLEAYAVPAPADFPPYKTFCGT